MPKPTKRELFAVCIANEGCDDLQIWKLYQVLPDESAAADDYLRVVDESGEDYLYPANRFVVVTFPTGVTKKLVAAATTVS